MSLTYDPSQAPHSLLQNSLYQLLQILHVLIFLFLITLHYIRNIAYCAIFIMMSYLGLLQKENGLHIINEYSNCYKHVVFVNGLSDKSLFTQLSYKLEDSKFNQYLILIFIHKVQHFLSAFSLECIQFTEVNKIMQISAEFDQYLITALAVKNNFSCR